MRERPKCLYPEVSVSVDESQIENYLYHCTVLETEGNLEQYKEMEMWIDDEDRDANNLMDVTVAIRYNATPCLSSYMGIWT